MNFLGHAGASMIAFAGLDTACWHLAARAAWVPLHRYLGGAATRVETYASSGLWLDRTVDADQAWPESFAIRAGREFEVLDIFWLEEPVFCTDL